jgi:S1-C subfamily serine protease
MHEQPPGYTGFTIAMTGTPGPTGPVLRYPVIRDVLPHTPAAPAGLISGDIIVEVNGVDARTAGSLYPVVGERYAMRIRRGDTEYEIALTPVPKPLRRQM